MREAAARPDLRQARRLLARGESLAAASLCARALAGHPEDFDCLRLHCRCCLACSDYRGALKSARRASELRPRNVQARLRLAWCLWLNGQAGEALALASEVERTAGRRAGALGRAATFHADCGRHEAAWRCRLRALEARPDDPGLVRSAADSAAALGHAEQAEAPYDRALLLRPDDHEVVARRAMLDRHSPVRNHVQALGFLLDGLDRDDPDRAPVAYALARELTTLEHHEAAFGMLREGARCRALRADHDPRSEEDRIVVTERCFDARWFDRAGIGDGAGTRSPGPVFVAGLPCSGMARLERLLDAAADVRGLGETRVMIHAVARLAGPHQGWAERMHRAAGLSPGRLGEACLEAVGPLHGGVPRWLDRSPGNVLLLGLVARALPGARILHLRRDPLDHCLALYRAWFPEGHGHTFDLEALGRHFSAYHRLMGHWRRHLGGQILDVDFEALLARPGETRERVRDFIGLPPADDDPVPDDDGSEGVGLSRHYRQQLAPLARRLREDGIPLD